MQEQNRDTKSLKSKKKQSYLLGCLISLGAFLVLIGILASIKVTPYELYTNEEHGFKIAYPAYWKVIDKPFNLAVVAFRSPREDDMDLFSENVAVRVLDVKGKNLTLKKFGDDAIKKIVEPTKGQLNVIRSEEIKLAGHPGYAFAFTTRVTPGEDYIIYSLEWTIVDDKAYTLVFATLNSQKKKYGKMANKMFRSFKLL